MDKHSNNRVEEIVSDQSNNSGKHVTDRRVVPDADPSHTKWKEQQREAHGNEVKRQSDAREIDKGEESKDNEETR